MSKGTLGLVIVLLFFVSWYLMGLLLTMAYSGLLYCLNFDRKMSRQLRETNHDSKSVLD